MEKLPFPSLKRRGGCTEWSEVQTGWSVRPKSLAGMTTPSAPFKGGFATFSLCRVHPSFSRRGKIKIRILNLVMLFLFPTLAAHAQAGRGNAPATPKAASPSDFTGYWVSVVTEDWLYRMV